MTADIYLDTIIEKMQRLKEVTLPSINEATDKVMQTLKDNKSIYFFGCTHAGILTQEVFYRTGGLAIFNPIFAPGLMADTSPITLTSDLERTAGYGEIIAQQSGIVKGDLLFIHSVSGRNNVPIDLAIALRRIGVFIICITSLEYSKNVKSRHSSGKRLFEVSDLVIDNVCPYGDALVNLPKSNVMVGPASTVMGAAIVNAIAVNVAAKFDDQEDCPPVFSSANMDEGDDYNKKIIDKYKKFIRYKTI